MNETLQLIIRHGLASLGAFFASHNITGDTTTSIVVGLVFCAIPTVWSWTAKMLHIDDLKGADSITSSEVFRSLVGSLVSQGITALSVYFGTDANSPELLIIAVVNAGASKLGLHQKMMGLPSAQVLIACVCMISLSSCAFLASRAGIAAIEQIAVPLASIGLQAAVDHGKLSSGDAVTLQRGLAVVTNQADPTVVKVFNLAELGLQTAVSKGVIKPGDSVLIQDAAAVIQRAVMSPQSAPSAKQPVKVSSLKDSGQDCPRYSGSDLRHAVDDAQGDPAMPPLQCYPAMKQSGVSIPLYGAAVAAHLAAD